MITEITLTLGQLINIVLVTAVLWLLLLISLMLRAVYWPSPATVVVPEPRSTGAGTFITTVIAFAVLALAFLSALLH